MQAVDAEVSRGKCFKWTVLIVHRQARLVRAVLACAEGHRAHIEAALRRVLLDLYNEVRWFPLVCSVSLTAATRTTVIETGFVS